MHIATSIETTFLVLILLQLYYKLPITSLIITSLTIILCGQFIKFKYLCNNHTPTQYWTIPSANSTISSLTCVNGSLLDTLNILIVEDTSPTLLS